MAPSACLALLRCWQGEAERRALPQRAGHGDVPAVQLGLPPAVQLYEGLGEYQSQSGAAPSLGHAILGAEEFGEETRLVVGGEANPRAPDADAHATPFAACGDGNASPGRRILMRV